MFYHNLDDHHQFFHCNFGQSTSLFDRLHGTMARVEGEYGEHRFMDGGGEGFQFLG